MQFIDAVTAFEQKHFDRTSMTVLPHAAVDIAALLGFPLDDEQIKGLSGAPSGSSIEVFYKTAWTEAEVGPELVPPGLYFSVENPTYLFHENIVGLFLDGSSSQVGIYIKLTAFDAKKAPKRVAARMLAVMVREALRLPGITRIKLLAAGGRTWGPMNSIGERWGGYMAWPTYGFDMNLLPETNAIASEFPYYPPNLSACGSVSDVLSVAGGRDYWRIAGDGWYMTFDLSSAGSSSIAALDKELGNARV